MTLMTESFTLCLLKTFITIQRSSWGKSSVFADFILFLFCVFCFAKILRLYLHGKITMKTRWLCVVSIHIYHFYPTRHGNHHLVKIPFYLMHRRTLSHYDGWSCQFHEIWNHLGIWHLSMTMGEFMFIRLTVGDTSLVTHVGDYVLGFSILWKGESHLAYAFIALGFNCGCSVTWWF